MRSWPKFAMKVAEFRKDAQDKIFELYFTTKKDGSGIGLAQTYQICNGITVPWTSNPPKGPALFFDFIFRPREH